MQEENIVMGDFDEDLENFEECEKINDLIKETLEDNIMSKKELVDVIESLYLYPLSPVYLKFSDKVYIKYKICYDPVIREDDKIINIRNEEFKKSGIIYCGTDK